MKAVMLALLFPFVHLTARTLVPRAALAMALSRARALSPGLDEEFLLNQARHSVRTAAPWLLIVTSVLTLLIAFFALRFTRDWIESPSKKGRLHIPALLGTALGLNIALQIMITLLPIPEPWMAEHAGRVSDPLGAAGFFPKLLCTVVFVPLAEETVFRKFCMNFLRCAFTPATAVLCQALLFAAFHGTKLQMVYVFPAAIVLGLVYLWSGRLSAPLLLHMAFNAVSLTGLPLPDPGWGQWLLLFAGAASAVLGLRSLWLKRSARPVSANMSPHPPPR
jgi:membrane protease YdiL (CAAX protease family)